MTDTASLPTSRSADLPAEWWAPALTLTERLAAPGNAGAPAGPLPADAAPWAAGDPEGFALRLARLGVDEAGAAALATEPAARLAARAAEPDWARFAAAVLATAPREPVRQHDTGSGSDPAAGADDAEVFAPVVRPLVAEAGARLAARLPAGPDAERAVWRAAFERRLGHQLVRQAARTLVRELDRARRAGRLTGGGPRARFASFVAATGTRQGLAALFAAYPVLARMLARTALDAVDATAELAARLTADRADLAAGLLGGDPGPLTRLELGRGDAHRGNRAVAVLEFAGGARLVHKPRPLDQHALLDELVAWLNAKVPGLDLRTARSLRRDGYGWLEFVEHRWCRSVTETDAFYRRQGALLALLYAVDGADMHYENVIACGDQPVLVDAETLLHTGLGQAMTAGADPAADALHTSVHRTCLLPHLLIGEEGALDISALGRSTDGTFPSEGLRWLDSGLDTMRAVRAPLPSPAAQNQPLPAGRPLADADHRAALIEGFRAGYAALAAHGTELLGEEGPLSARGQRPARLIVRSTRLYATLLEESAHPALLGDALAREGVFAVLCTESAHDPARAGLVEDETAALWRGDIPLFTHLPSGTGVLTDTGREVPGVLPVASLDAVRAKIARMDEVDCHDQEWIIAATLAARGAAAPADRPRSELAAGRLPAVVPGTSRLLAAACGIADEIAARAVRGGDRTNWLGLERVSGPHWAVLPMGAGLAQGYCGVALFLAHADALTGADRYAAPARDAVRPLPALLKALAADPELSAAAGPGAYDGIGGIVYALLRLSALLDEDLTACLPDALTALAQAAASCPRPGLGDGTAGALAAAVAAYEATGDPAALRLADDVADALLAALPGGVAPAGAAPGLADGTAGIGWALLRYAAVRPERAARHEDAARALLGAALREAAAAPDASWTAGLAGAAAGAADSAPLAELSRAAALLADSATAPDLSLGQGALGVLDALAVLRARGADGAPAALDRLTGQALAVVEAQDHRCATPDHVPSPGLLTGLAGIGYGLLRLAHPTTVPSALLLELPDRRG
ncbi:type 2 lanthipeptide synthetase LanM family protein [Streptomyces sp. NPDC086091]|uniref:type 2 lanthipeptide synthetase LanM family protein n=1 Tax=Streptomyces sp. NPDC086091 TaxID=3365751 RepID=UPI0037F62BC8